MTFRHLSQSGIIVAAALALWSLPTSAMEASNKEAIRLLANEAAGDYATGRYEAALGKFQRAYDTAKVPRLAVWLAKTQLKLGHLVAAYELYRQATNFEKGDLWIGTTQQEAQQEAEEELRALQTRIPRLTVRVKGANPSDVSLKIDDVDVPSTLIGVERFADPGQKQIVGRAGDKEVREQATLVEGESKEVVLTFPQPAAVPVPPTTTDTAPKRRIGGTVASTPSATTEGESRISQGKTQRTWGWVSLGVGAAGTVLGVTTGILVVADHRPMNTNCPNHQCKPTYWSDANTYDTLRHLSTAGFIVAGVGAATGITLLLTSPEHESKPSVGLWVAPASAGLKGMF
jgi:phenylpyruvate tautomerase PptA (4-oxalocrotonate tautomerase family)